MTNHYLPFLLLCFAAVGFGCAMTPKAKVPHVRTGPEPELQRQARTYPAVVYLEGLGHSKKVAFTFDDGPGDYTEDLLDVLRKHGVKATFFWTGAEMKKRPAVVRAAATQGHLIGNHTYSHPHSRELSLGRFWHEEVKPTQDLILRLAGYTPALFRPPYGEITDAQIEMLELDGIKVIGWSIDPKDWSMKDEAGAVATISDTIRVHLHPEAIVLMHDGIYGYTPNTIRAVDELIPELIGRGYKFVTIDELLTISGRLAD